jgi:hypothetical protein
VGHADSTLAMLLRKELTEHITSGYSALVKRPNERTAGRFEAFEAVMAILEDKTDHIENPRPEEQRQNGG